MQRKNCWRESQEEKPIRKSLGEQPETFPSIPGPCLEVSSVMDAVGQPPKDVQRDWQFISELLGLLKCFPYSVINQNRSRNDIMAQRSH